MCLRLQLRSEGAVEVELSNLDFGRQEDVWLRRAVSVDELRTRLELGVGAVGLGLGLELGYPGLGLE